MESRNDLPRRQGTEDPEGLAQPGDVELPAGSMVPFEEAVGGRENELGQM